MKKLYFSVIIALLVASMSSFQDGFGANRGQGATGAPGEQGQSCGQGGCHTSGSFSPSLDLFLTDENGVEVEEYIANTTYTVSLVINTTGLPAAYGFQMVSLINDGDQPLNTFSDFAASISEVTIGDRQYVEHNDPIPSETISLTWTAPDANTGPVTFYAAGNAVNRNFSPSGDGVTRGEFVVQQSSSTSTSDVEDSTLAIFPNPTYGSITIPNDVQVSTAIITSMEGRQLATIRNSNVVDITDLTQGIYLLTITDSDQKVYTQKIQKL